MYVSKALPGGASGGFYWENPGDVLEVPDWLGEQLLDIPNGGFSEVEPAGPEEEVPEEGATLTPGQKAAATRAANKAAAEAAAKQE